MHPEREDRLGGAAGEDTPDDPSTWRHARRLIQFAVLCVLVIALGLIGSFSRFGGPGSSAQAQAATFGSWTAPMTWPTIAIHSAVLHDGRLLQYAYPHDGTQATTARVWKPSDNSWVTVPIASDIFCSGQVFLPDGNMLIIGGQDPAYPQAQEDFGVKELNRFNVGESPSFTALTPMKEARWYPTGTALADGRVLITSGYDAAANITHKLEIWDPSTGSNYLGAPDLYVPLYPWMHLLPSGKVWFSGPSPTSVEIDVANKTWKNNPTNFNGGNRYDGTSVLLPLSPPYNTPEIMIMGGGQPATNTTERIFPAAANPTWTYRDNMNHGRKHANAVLLPTGKMLITGGTSNNNDPAFAVTTAEMYDPAANTWTDMASNQRPRMYHSSSVLLPDGRVLTAGTDGEFTAEIYSPPYLFAGPRPTISDLPTSVGWNSNFLVTTPDASTIDSVMLMRPSSVTHSFNQEQRAVKLDFQAGNGVLRVSGPPNGNVAPPGYYMLFILKSGVPSVAGWVKIGTTTDNDGDGLTNTAETNTYATNPNAADTDLDSLSDGAEINTYNSNPKDTDTDDDGLGDWAEVMTYGTLPNDTDTDNDGLSDFVEAPAGGTDPLDADTDNDGLNDGAEVNTYHTDPLDNDSDNDGLTDGAEVNTHQTNPLDNDTDNDGLTDGAEVNTYGSDPKDTDTDNDGLTDGAEVNTYGTEPDDADTDNDGLNDGAEVNTYDTDPDDSDSDNDGLNDGAEVNTYNTDPLDNDSDSDGLNDGAEVNTHHTNPLDSDSDDDSLTDGQEVNTYQSNPLSTDSDNDLLLDGFEVQCGSKPADAQSTPEKVGGAFTGVNDDRDGSTDEALPAGAVSADCDRDGYTGTLENQIYTPVTTGDQHPCGTSSAAVSGWPNDFVDGMAPGENAITISDIISFLGPVRRFGTIPGDANYSPRWDLLPGNGIDIQDLLSLAAGSTDYPPMLGGARAFGRPACPWPP